MSLSITKPLPKKPKVEEEAKEAEEEQEAEAEDALTHLHRKVMQTQPKTQGMTRVLVPAVDEPPRLRP